MPLETCHKLEIPFDQFIGTYDSEGQTRSYLDFIRKMKKEDE